MWWIWTAAVTFAQDGAPERFNGQLLRPSVDSSATLWLEETRTAPDGYGTARAFLQYGNGVVRWQGDHLVSDLVEVDLLGAWHWRGLRLGAHLPVYLLAAGELARDEPGLGDLAVDLKATLLNRADSPVGVAVMGRLLVPTASVEVPLGSSGTGWEITGVVDRQLDDWTLVANVGIRDVQRVTFGDLVWNDAVFGRLGAGYAFHDGLGASAELSAQTNWASARSPAGTAVELLAGGWGRVRDELVVRGGVSTGLSRSPGAPLARLMVGLSWEPDPHPDRDLDGLTDRDDWCPDDPEDPDGFEDWDGCADTAVTAQVQAIGPDGSPLDALVLLEGPEPHRLDPGDPYVTLHPGTYRASATVDGFVPWAGEIEVPAEQGHRVALPLVPEEGSIRVWAVDHTGATLPAEVRISGGAPIAAGGAPIPLRAGEHALVVTAPGFRAEALSVDVDHGRGREVSVVLVPDEPDEPDDAPDPRGRASYRSSTSGR